MPPTPLPDDLDQLKQLIRDLFARLQRSELEQARLRELLEAKRDRQSEKLSGDQLALFAAMWEARQGSAVRRGRRRTGSTGQRHRGAARAAAEANRPCGAAERLTAPDHRA